MDQLNLNRQAGEWLYERSAAGLCITGESGSGKSVLLRQLCRTVAQQQLGALFVFDPHGSLTKSLRLDFQEYERAFQRKLYYYEPGNFALPVGCLNPLAVSEQTDDTPGTWKQRVQSRALTAGRILLASFGERDFDEKPQLFKWTTIILRSLAALGLTIPDARFLLQVGTDLFHQIVDALPSVDDQWEFRQIASLRVSEQNEILGSTRSRFFSVDAPLLHWHLGGPPANWISVQSLIDEQAIVLVNLEIQGKLDTFQRSLLANFWLSELLNTILNASESSRKPTFICCDELATFKASAFLIEEVLKEIRKMKTRFIGAFQGVTAFPERQDDPLLQSMAQCGTTFIFKHKLPLDADYFANLTALPQYDPTKVKFEYWEEQQYQDGNEVVTLEDQSESRGEKHSKNKGTSQVKGKTTTQSTEKATGHSDSSQVGQSNTSQSGKAEASGDVRSWNDASKGKTLFPDAISQQNSTSTNELSSTGTQSARTNTNQNTQSEGTSIADSVQETKSEGEDHGTNQSTGITRKQQLVPIQKWRDILKFMEFFSAEEQVRLDAARIARLQPGEALMLTADGNVQQVRIPLPTEPFAKEPSWGKSKLKHFLAELSYRPQAISVSKLLEYRQQFEQVLPRLIEQSKTQRGSIEASSDTAIPKPTNRSGSDEESDLTI